MIRIIIENVLLFLLPTLAYAAYELLKRLGRPDNAPAAALLDALLPHTGGSVRLGIPGTPGVGKSTIIDTLVATPSEANHFFSALKTFFNWCEQRQLISRSPLASLSKPAKEVSRDRTLSDEELQNVWNATTSFSQFNTIVRLCILTGQRRGELARIEPSWITQTTLTIPASVSKNNSEHTIPLTPFTLDLITTTPLGSYNSWSQPKAKLDRRSGVTGWTLHDLRRTFSTIHAQIGTPPHITERLLNHLTGTLSPIARIYNRHTFADEMRSALIAYENHLRTILVFPPEHLAPISA